ncbi:hypothetical protein L1987_00928 [Smallanthus sonchifolius]|uniref:Uncharacterized protein n=1 Tax=Smallanthus sonchifolius TaxID=185202 RepID=A0ACB9K3N6_9ASTR|nr:hypothetical protein L1987_00928 [Smallanthus sonchifolius]
MRSKFDEFVLSLSPTLTKEALREVVVDTLMECLKDGNAGKFHSSAYHKFIHTLALLICLICGILCMMRVMIFMVICFVLKVVIHTYRETCTGFDHKKAKWDAKVVSSFGYAKSSKHIGNEKLPIIIVTKYQSPSCDGIYIPATDDEMMKAEDLIDHKSSQHYVLDNSQTAVCNSNDDTFDFLRVFKVPKVYSLYSSQFAAYADVVLLEPPVMEGLDLLLMRKPIRSSPNLGICPITSITGMIHTSTRYSKFIRNYGNSNKKIDKSWWKQVLKRWEIGEIASRIGQLIFGQYMRTGQANYLSEAYIFYEAVLTREYFKDGTFQDLNLANKQLRFLARFLTVCLVLNRREMVHQLVNQLKMLVAESKRTFPENDFKEWKRVMWDLTKFLKVDTDSMNIWPLRYSIVLDLDPECLPRVACIKRNLKLRDAILCSYHPNEVKFSELTTDNFRMLQCLEWEPSGSFYQSSETHSTGQNGALAGSTRINHYSHEITDPTMPQNPRKALLYHPSTTHLIAVLATMCEELPADGILLIYISASGSGAQASSDAVSTLPSCSACDTLTSSFDYSGGLNLGPGGTGFNMVYPSDLLPFTRRPLFLIIDSDSSKVFQAINMAQKGEPVAILLSPAVSFPIHGAIDSPLPSGSQFTSFLTVPLQALIVLLGISGSDIQTENLNKAHKILSLSLNKWGEMLASSDTIHPVWAHVLRDPFLRRLLLRFIFCRAVFALYAPTSGKKEYLPECSPSLPDAFLPTTPSSIATVLQIADIFGAATMFNIRERIILPDEQVSSP